MPLRWLMFAVLLAAAAPGVRAQTTWLQVSTWLPPGHVLSTTLVQWCSLLDQRTAGKLQCRFAPRPVAPAPGTFDAVREGRIDLAFTVQGYTPGRFELAQMAELPFLGDHAEAGSVAFQRMVDRVPALADEYQGVKLLAVFTHGPALLLNTRRPVARLEDVAGLRFRVGGGMASEIAKLLGTSVALKPPQDSLKLLESGALDGTLGPAESVQAFGIAPVLRHATVLPGGWYNTAFAFLMNRSRYDALTPALRRAIDEIAGEFAARMFGRAWDDSDRAGLALLKSHGVQWVRADPGLVGQVAERVAPLEQRWAAAARAKGVREPERLLADFRAEIQRLER